MRFVSALIALLMLAGTALATNRVLIVDDQTGMVQNFTNIYFVQSGTNVFGSLTVSNGIYIPAGGTITFGGEVRSNWPTSSEGIWASNHLNAVEACSREPMGICYDINPTFYFTNATRTFVMTTPASWVYWHAGIPYTNGTSISKAITTNIGTHYLYYDDASGTLKESMTAWNFSNNVQVATVLWDGNQGLVSKETHGMTMDWSTHKWIHATLGMRLEWGFPGTFSLTNMVIGAGSVHDEDLEFDYTQQTNAMIITHTNGVIYLQAAAGLPYMLTSPNVIVYDNGTTTNAVAAGEYVAYWVFVSDAPSYPIILLPGQRVDSTLANARANNTVESLYTGTLPMAEMHILYRLIFHRQLGVGTLIYDEAQDLRSVTAVPSYQYTPTDHGTLSGLMDDDHTQYVLVDGTRALGGPWNVGTNLQINGTQIVSVAGADGVLTPDADTLDGYDWNGVPSLTATNLTSVSNIYIGVDGKLGIGTTNVTGDFDIWKYGVDGSIQGRRAGGTPSVPTNTPAFSTIFSLSGRPYGTTNWASGSRISVTARTWNLSTDADQSTYLTVNTTPIGSTTSREAFVVMPNGEVKYNDITTGPLTPVASAQFFSSNGVMHVMGTDGYDCLVERKLTQDTTINMVMANTVAQNQALIDAAPKNLNGKTLTIQFPAGTHTQNTAYVFSDYYGGILDVAGTVVSSTLHSNQTSILFCTNTAAYPNPLSIGFFRCTADTIVRNLRIDLTNSGQYAFAILYRGCYGKHSAYYNWLRSNTSGYGRGIGVQYSVVYVTGNYFTAHQCAVMADANGLVGINACGSTGTLSTYGHYASGGTMWRRNTTALGSTDNIVDTGGNILTSAGLIEP